MDSALRRRRGSSNPACRADKNPSIPSFHIGLRAGRCHDRTQRRGCSSGASHWLSVRPSGQWRAPLLESTRIEVGETPRSWWAGSAAGAFPLWLLRSRQIPPHPRGGWCDSMGWSQRLFGVLRRALSKEVKEQVGTDRFGNKYYYIPEYKNWRGEMRARAAAGWSENDVRHDW